MIDYYCKNFQDYHKKTFSIDPSTFLGPFLNRLESGAKVLDVGCGSGRDLLYLMRKGFKVVGFERSFGLACLARENARCEIIQGDFKSYDFSLFSVDAILLSGSLVHVPHERMAGVFGNIIKALKNYPFRDQHLGSMPEGIVFISLKEGTGVNTNKDGRVFYFWQDSDLRKIFGEFDFTILHFSRNESAVGSGDIWLGYTLGRQGINGR